MLLRLAGLTASAGLSCILIVPPNGAINYYFYSAIGNSILSVHYQIVGVAETWGKCVNLLCNLNVFMLATCSI